MFSQASVILFTGVRVADTPLGKYPPGQTDSLGRHPLAETPSPGQTPPDQCLLGYTPSSGHCSGQYASYWNAFLLEGMCSVFKDLIVKSAQKFNCFLLGKKPSSLYLEPNLLAQYFCIADFDIFRANSE